MNDSIIHSIAILGKIEKAYISIEQLFNYAQGFIQYAFLREPSSFLGNILKSYNAQVFRNVEFFMQVLYVFRNISEGKMVNMFEDKKPLTQKFH